MKNIKKIVSVLLCAVLLLGVMPVMSFSAETTQLVLGELCEVYIEEHDYAVLTFTPSESAYYRIKSIGYDDVCIDCYDGNGEWIGGSDDDAVGYNFNFSIYLEKGVTYSFEISSYEDYYAETSVILEKLSGKSMTKMTEDVEYSVNLDGSGESQWFSFTPKRDGYYAFYSEEAEDSFGYIYDSEWILLNKNDDAAEHWNFYVEAYLFEGETYYFEASAYDELWGDSYAVKVEEVTVIEEINVTQMPYDTTCYKNYVGETLSLSGLELELVYSDGSVVEWSYDNYEDIFGVEVEFDWYIDENDDAYVGLWTAFAYTEFDVNDIECPVESIVVESMPEITLIEGVDGYYDYWDDNFIYDYYIPEDVMIEVTYKDGSKETVGIWQTINGYGFDFYDYQRDGYTWEVGENYVIVEYFDVSTVLPVNVIENPVESIVLDNAPTKEYVFGDEEYGYYDEEFDEYELYPTDFEGFELTVNYKDGTSETYDSSDIVFDESMYEWTLDGYILGIYYVYAEEPGVYEGCLRYMGYEVTYDITILDKGNAPYVLGDADGDSEVSVMDASLIQMFLVGKKDIVGDATLAADADCDGEISVMDASLIQMYLVGKKELG